MLKDKANLYRDFGCIGLCCYICDQGDHIAKYCPQTHLILNKPRIIKQYIDEEQSFADSFNRKKKKRFHALLQLRILQKTVRSMRTGDTLKNQTTTFTDGDLNVSDVIRAKRPTFIVPDDDADGETEYLETMPYQTLTRIKDEETGVVRLVKPKTRSIGKESRPDLLRSVTMKNALESTTKSIHLEMISGRSQEVVIDQMKNYEIYFPHNNIRKLIEQLENLRLKKKTYKINLASEQDVHHFKMKLGKIFHRTKKMTWVDISSKGEISPKSRRKSMFYRKSVKPVYVRQRSKSVGKDVSSISPAEFQLKYLSYSNRSNKSNRSSRSVLSNKV